MLRKSTASDAWAEFFENARKLFQNLQKVTEFYFFPYLKFVCFSIIKKMTLFVSVEPD